MADREQVLIFPDETGGGGFPFLVVTELNSRGSSGGLLELLLPLILIATIIPGLIPPAAAPATAAPTTATPTSLACPVCTAPITCTTPAPCVPTPACPDGFMKLMNGGTTIPNKCYLFITTAAKFVPQLQACTTKGGDLANPITPDEGLALKTYLQINHAGIAFYFGYTDMYNGEVVISLSGGSTNPIPGLDVDADTNKANSRSDCTTISVAGDGTVAADTPTCGTLKNAVCEINLSTQKCVCP